MAKRPLTRDIPWWVWAVCAGCFLSASLAVGDVMLDPPSGVMRVLLWPADLLLWVTGFGVKLRDGRYEWTPVQDFAMWLGAGVAVVFWIMMIGFTLRRAFVAGRRPEPKPR
jgi:hypothetical protein